MCIAQILVLSIVGLILLSNCFFNVNKPIKKKKIWLSKIMIIIYLKEEFLKWLIFFSFIDDGDEGWHFNLDIITRLLFIIWTLKKIKSFFFREFQFMVSVPNNNSLLLNQDTNQFWCRGRLKPKSLIQPSETLLVELINKVKLSIF